jgi:dipeptidase E
VGLVNFAVIPHFDPDASMTIAEKWASMLPCPVYAIDDETAVQVTGETVDVVSEGSWKFFNPA